jgi:hypothetical protein
VIRWPWKLLHNLVAHPYLALTGAIGAGEASAATFHDWTGAHAWPVPTDAEERRLEVWEKLREAEGAAEAAGFEHLADALGTVAALWAAGFEDRAALALDHAAAPLLSLAADELPVEPESIYARAERRGDRFEEDARREARHG